MSQSIKQIVSLIFRFHFSYFNQISDKTTKHFSTLDSGLALDVMLCWEVIQVVIDKSWVGTGSYRERLVVSCTTITRRSFSNVKILKLGYLFEDLIAVQLYFFYWKCGGYFEMSCSR